MGGSGGGYFSKEDADKAIARLKQEAEERSKNVQLDTEVADVIDGLLREYNDRKEEIPGHLESIKRALEKEIEGTIDLIFGGSIARHTYVDGLSDVDSLVLLDSCDLVDKSPELAKKYIADRLKKRFPNTYIKEGDIAVKVQFARVEVQLVPAVRCGNDVAISNAKGTQWLKIRPKEFARALTQVNDVCNRKLVPMVKIVKGINAKLPENQRLKSYHIESLAIEIFKNYSGVKTSKKMIQHFFAEAPIRVLSRIKDKTGQTRHVDDYLGASNSLERNLVANALGRISRRMKNADISGSVDEWSDILG